MTNLAIATEQTGVPDGYQRLTNRMIERIHAALFALSQRRLNGPEAEKKVVILLRRYFGPAHEIYEALRNKRIEAYPVPDGWDESRLPVAVAESRSRAIEALLSDTQDLPTIPEHFYLRDGDMPKIVKGELGDANQMAVAEIKTKLDFLYPIGDEEG